MPKLSFFKHEKEEKKLISHLNLPVMVSVEPDSTDNRGSMLVTRGVAASVHSK